MVQGLVINGTVGVGKTTTAEAIGHRWRVAEVAGAVIDVDWLRYNWPAPPADPFNAELGLANLVALAGSYVRQGAQALVLADVVEDRPARDRQRRALTAALPGLDYRMVRLRGEPEMLQLRLLQRHRLDTDGGIARDWHLRRVIELEQILDAARPEDAVVEVTGLEADQVAGAVLAAAGWDEARPSDAHLT